MPGFGGALTEQEIRALVIFIREKVDEARRAETTYAKPRGDAVVKSEEHAFRVETVVEGVETPWSVAFLPDGRMLVTEKAGRLRLVEKGRLLPPVEGVPPVWSQGQGGLMDVAVHPDYEKNGWIYLSFSDPGENGTAMTKVVRGKLRDGRLVEPSTGGGRCTSAPGSSSTGRATSSSRSGSGASATTRRTSRARTARSTASSTTGASPRTTRS
jgi:glucose/arabinose dehydrogenase